MPTGGSVRAVNNGRYSRICSCGRIKDKTPYYYPYFELCYACYKEAYGGPAMVLTLEEKIKLAEEELQDAQEMYAKYRGGSIWYRKLNRAKKALEQLKES